MTFLWILNKKFPRPQTVELIQIMVIRRNQNCGRISLAFKYPDLASRISVLNGLPYFLNMRQSRKYFVDFFDGLKSLSLIDGGPEISNQNTRILNSKFCLHIIWSHMVDHEWTCVIKINVSKKTKQPKVL